MIITLLVTVYPQAEYLDNMRKNYSGWMRNTISAEMEDWKKSDDPELDTETW